MTQPIHSHPSGSIAIIGMACRFPGASHPRRFWENLRCGFESISFFSSEELAGAGLDPELLSNPNYVKARSVLEGIEMFDADFFGYNPKEAECMDPQQRLFLEGAWEALENAGYDPDRYGSAIGVYAGVYLNTYLLANLCSSREFIESLLSFKKAGTFQTFLGNDKDYLTTRVAYKLNLKGPAVTVQTACSTSLVAVCMACHSLLNHQCDMALAGGITITCPQRKGYLHQEGGMLSPDGHCRPFDAEAQGTVFGNGMGIVVLKRLEDALADRDSICAVIKGAALNNDGSGKVSYTAPSVNGQADAIVLAHALAGVSAESIGYVEAHGTATPLGDPIEVAALTQAFRATTDAKGFCGIGSVKSNIGHLDVAAGVAGLIKAALALQYREIPATLHFQTPNPKLDLDNSPFYVVDQLKPWTPGRGPRRAGVSSFGVGGTNAHVVLEEAPSPVPRGAVRPVQLLVWSARTAAALEAATQNLARHFQEHPDIEIGDVAFTLQVGRKAFDHRRMLVCRDLPDAAAALSEPGSKRLLTRQEEGRDAPVVFMFPGQGSQYAFMGSELYRSERVFREALDRCADYLAVEMGLDLRQVLYPSQTDSAAANEALRQTRLAQPALFAVEYALAQLWMSWGLQPQALIGHSVGEYVAACLAGVFDLETALKLIATRARLVQAQPPGSMTAVRLGEEKLGSLLNGELSIAAVNLPELCIVSGPVPAVEALEQRLQEQGLACRRLTASHAFHSAMMEPVLEPFEACVRQCDLRPPSIPCVSTVTGSWLTASEAVDPAYWSGHIRRTVRFADAVAELFKEPRPVLLEVGPGTTLSTLARRHPAKESGQLAVHCLPVEAQPEAELSTFWTSAGQLWLAGVSVDWERLHEQDRPRRVPLPGYPFERKRYWIEAPRGLAFASGSGETIPASPRIEAISDPSRPAGPPAPATVIQPPSAMNADRKRHLLTAILTLLREMSGTQLREQDAASTFLELGFDSLFLTQARQSLQSQFGVKITYRQLSEDLSTPEALAAYLDQNLPADAVSLGPPRPPRDADAPPSDRVLPPAPSTGEPVSCRQSSADAASVPSSSASTPLAMESIFQHQLRAMNELMSAQLALLRGEAPRPSGQAQSQMPFDRDPQANGSLPAAIPPRPAAAVPPVPQPEPAPAPRRAETQAFGPFRPVARSTDGRLRKDQEDYLGEFIARYTRRTAASKRLAQEFRKPLADPRSVVGFRKSWKELIYQIVVDRSSGSRLWDVDGNEYVDMTMGFGVNLFGHSPSFVVKAIEAQLSQGMPIGPQSPLAGEVASLIIELTGMERVTFCNTGSEAVMAALRVARTVTGRSKISFFAGDYHGMFDEVLLRPHPVDGPMKSAPVAPGIPSKIGDGVMILPYGASESLDILKTHASELAAILVEPVQSRHPDLQPREFLHALRRIADTADCALIFDEVITGFRIHPGGAQAWFGVQADLAAYGKVIGGGLPIGVLAGRSRWMDCLDGGAWQFGDDSAPEADMTFFAGTFVRHPLALAAARSVLTHLREAGPQLQASLNQTTTGVVSELNGFLLERGLPMRLEHFGSLFRFHFTMELPFAHLLFCRLIEKGFYFREAHQNCFLSTAHSSQDVAGFVHAAKESVGELQEAGFLPSAPRSGDSRTPAARSVSGGAPRSISFPLTEAQKEIWVACQMGSEQSRAYNESFSVDLRGPLNVEVLHQALREIVNRHEALRTTFDPSGEFQRVEPCLALPIGWADWSGATAEERDARAARIPREEADQPFDLARGPLVRIRIIRLASEHHRLVFTAHHLVCDGWSSNRILTELSALYAASVRGENASLPVPTQYREYAEFEKASRETAENAATEAWWLKQFESLPDPLELPVDRPQTPAKSNAGAVCRLLLDGPLHRELKALGARQNCTLFAILLAVFKVMLHRLSGQDDIVVGIFSAGQLQASMPDLVGHCVNMLPVRSSLEHNPAFAKFLADLRARLLEVREHENYTYGRLLQRLKLPRSPGRLPLVEVAFNLEPKETNLNFPGLKAEADQNPQAFVHLDLFLNVNETPNGLILDLEYNTSLFEAATMDRWLGIFQTLLQAAAARPSDPVGTLPLLAEPERKKLIVEWNQTDVPYDLEEALPALFEARAWSAPNGVALRWEGGEQTYAELNARANQLARRLAGMGVGPEVPVGLCLERSPGLIAAAVAVLKAGGAFVPLDPALPADRLDYAIRDTQMPVLITDDFVLENHPQVRQTAANRKWPPHVQVLSLDTLPGLAEEPERSNLEIELRGRNLAYIIYTSGTSGRPKGVLVEHRSIVNHLLWRQDTFPLGVEDRFLHKAPCSFDISVWEIFAPLLAGAQMVLAKPGGEKDPRYLARLMKSNGVTHAHFSPAMLRLMLEEADFQSNDALRRVFCGGEPLPTELARQFQAQSPAELIHQYGPTETTVDATWWRCERPLPDQARVPIGRPIANTQAYVLDRHLQPVPAGVPGELCVGGAGVGRGYLNEPALTSAVFVQDPFRPEPGARLYRTGDVCRYREDGALEFLRRTDRQVKVRGFRIELEEVQKTLGLHPAVKQNAVVVRRDEDDPRLVAYVVPQNPSGQEPGGRAEAAWLSELETQFDAGYGAAIEENAGDAGKSDPTLNIYAWSGLENTETEVEGWLEAIAQRVLAHQPKRLLEIGCGTGLVLAKLAPHCEEFWATDLSQTAIDDLQLRLAGETRDASHLRLLHRMAHDFHGIPNAYFDGIVLNAVVEYFPTLDYLRRVLQGAMKALVPGGFIFLGDVPNLAMAKAYHLGRQVLASSDTDTAPEILARALKRMEDDPRLMLAPEFFPALQQQWDEIGHVRTCLTPARFGNALSQLLANTHYDVFLYKKSGNTAESIDWIEYAGGGNWEKTLGRMAGDPSAILGVRGVPHESLRRLWRAAEDLSSSTPSAEVSEWKRRLAEPAQAEPWEELRRLAPCEIEIHWSAPGAEAKCDVLFWRGTPKRKPPLISGPARAAAEFKTLQAYANFPLQAKLARQWIPEWREFLKQRLPDYMIPNAFVILEQLPVSSRGKIDFHALPPPGQARPELASTYAAPRTPAEQAVAEIWSSLLRVEKVGVRDNFFELGGHSLLAIQVITRLRDSLQVELPMKTLFECPALEQLAAAVEKALLEEAPDLSDEGAKLAGIGTI